MIRKTRMMAALKIWVVIYPSITLFLFLFGEHLAAMPLYQKTFLLTIVLVPWVVFAGLPLLDAGIRSLSSKTDKAA